MVFSDGGGDFVTVTLTAGQTTGTANLSGLADGPISSVLSLSDPAGNTFGATGNIVTLDQDLGETVGLSVSGPVIGSASETAVLFTVTGEDDDQLVANTEEHIREKHPEMVGTKSREEILAMAHEA